MRSIRRTLDILFIVLFLTLWGTVSDLVAKSKPDTIKVTAERSCRPIMAESSNTKYTSASSQEVSLSSGTLVIIGGIDPIVAHTAIGNIEIPPGFAIAIQQDDSQVRISVIGCRNRVDDPERSTQSVTLTASDDDVYKLQLAHRLTASFMNDRLTDVVVSKIDPDAHEQLKAATAELSLADFRSEINGYDYSIRVSNRWAKTLLSLLGAGEASANDQPNVQIAVGEQFVAMQPGYLKSDKMAVQDVRKVPAS